MFKSLAAFAILLAVPALAKGPPTHQCMKDGAVVAKKKKECVPAGGTWELIPVKAKPAAK